MSDDKDFTFAEGEHNSGEHVSQSDIEQQQSISGWQGGVKSATGQNGDTADADEPEVE